MWKYDKKTACVKNIEGYWVDAQRWLSDSTWIQHLRDKSWWTKDIEKNFLEEMAKCIGDYKGKEES